MPETHWEARHGITWIVSCPNEGLKGDVLFSRNDPRNPSDPTEGFSLGSFIRNIVLENELPPYGKMEKRNVKRRRKKLCLLLARDNKGRKCSLDVPYFVLKLAVTKLYVQPKLVDRMETLDVDDILGLNELVKNGRGRGPNGKTRKLKMRYVWDAAFGLQRLRRRAKKLFQIRKKKDKAHFMRQWVKNKRAKSYEQRRLERAARIEAEHLYLTYKGPIPKGGWEGGGWPLLPLRTQAGRMGPGPGGEDPPPQPQGEGPEPLPGGGQ